MAFFDLFGKSQSAKEQPIEGELGFFGLAGWWLATFTEDERNYIESKYRPLGTGGDNSFPLTRGKIQSTTQTASGCLSGAASWFKKTEDFSIGKRFIEKSILLLGPNVLDQHFAYLQMIDVFYCSRDVEPTALDFAIQACECQIAIAPQAAKAFQMEYVGSPLPMHTGYEQLAIIREKQDDYAAVIEICKEAKSQGWAGDWDKRQGRCEVKMKRVVS